MSAASRPARSADRPRKIAWQVLRDVHERDAYANLALPKRLATVVMDERDRAFAAELAYGTLRAEGQLDHVLALCSTRALDGIEPGVLDVLRLGAYQLLRTRVPQHAAVATSVDLAHDIAGPRATGFVNAVLRQVSTRSGELDAPDATADPIGHLAVTTSHPRWIVEAFREALDGDLERARDVLLADDARPAVHLVARPGLVSRDELLDECAAVGLRAQPGPWSPYAVHLEHGDPGLLPAVRDGRAAVQDEGSQLAAIVASAAIGSAAARVLDLCAGPGGKAALLAALLPSASLVAADVHLHRARLAATAAQYARSALVVQADGRQPPWPESAFDGVLVDAPCTGLGALRRRPEARWRRQPGDVERLGILQRALLDSAISSVRPGGVVVWVVCSPHVREGRELLGGDTVTSRCEPVDVRPYLPDVPVSGTGTFVQLWPDLHGTDAMFIAAIRRRSG